jgi:hypothetical protein
VVGKPETVQLAPSSSAGPGPPELDPELELDVLLLEVEEVPLLELEVVVLLELEVVLLLELEVVLLEVDVVLLLEVGVPPPEPVSVTLPPPPSAGFGSACCAQAATKKQRPTATRVVRVAVCTMSSPWCRHRAEQASCQPVGTQKSGPRAPWRRSTGDGPRHHPGGPSHLRSSAPTARIDRRRSARARAPSR